MFKQYIFPCTLLLMLCGCDQIKSFISSSDNNEAVTLPATKIGVSISDATSNPFFATAKNAFERFGTEHSNINVLMHDAQNNSDGQMKAIENMIEQGVQAIVINMVNTDLAPQLLQKIKSANIPIVFFNRSPASEVLFSYDKAIFVDGDAVQGGILQGLDVLEGWRKHPEWDKNKDGTIQYAILKGIPGNPSAEARTQWSAGTLDSYPNLSFPAEEIIIEPAMFNEDKAYQIVNTWIDNNLINDIEVIMANNDVMAIGALKALKEHNIKLPIFGIDAITKARELLKEGELAGTVINDADTQAETSLRAAINLANNLQPLQGIDNRMEYQKIFVPYKVIK